jgi:hypothetical protein
VLLYSTQRPDCFWRSAYLPPDLSPTETRGWTLVLTSRTISSPFSKASQLWHLSSATYVHCMNSSRADSRVNCLKTSDVSETHSVSILRETYHFPWGWRPTPTFQRHIQSPSAGKVITFPEHGDWLRRFRDTFSLHPQGKWSLSLRMETECVSETSEVFKQLTRLSA